MNGQVILASAQKNTQKFNIRPYKVNSRKQQKIWETEHLNSTTLPSVGGEKPSGTVVDFLEFLKTNNLVSGKRLVDIGCGKGRNAIYLAQAGLSVYGLDYIDKAIEHAKEQAKINSLEEKTNFSVGGIDTTWNFPDNYFDLALDCFASIDVETKEGREFYKKEMFRTLKPGGYALVCVVSANDIFEAELMKNSPGKEPNSSIWPSGKFQKNYTKDELKNFYKEFNVVEFKERVKPSFKLGKAFSGTTYYFLIQKP